MFANAVFLSEFDIDKGSVLRHRVPAQALEEVQTSMNPLFNQI